MFKYVNLLVVLAILPVETSMASEKKNLCQEILSCWEEKCAALKEGLVSADEEVLLDAITNLSDLNVSFVVNTEEGARQYEGRIIRLSLEGSELVMSLLPREQTPDGSLGPIHIAASTVGPDSVSVFKDLSEYDKARTIEAFQEAVKQGKMVRFIEQRDTAKELSGRIRNIKIEDKSQSFVLTQASGYEVGHDMGNVVPESIEFIDPPEPELSKDESNLLLKLHKAHDKAEFVAFQVAGENKLPYLFQGWVTEVELAVDGGYLISVNRDRYEVGSTETKAKSSKTFCFKIRLEDIIASTFEADPTLSVDSNLPKGKFPLDIVAYQNNQTVSSRFEVVNKVRGLLGKSNAESQELSASGLISELSLMAVPSLATGPELPASLDALVSPGKELRLYFGVPFRRVRLVIRRDKNGAWAFGNSVKMGPDFYAEEGFRDGDSLYTFQEGYQLKDPVAPNQLPASELRHHLVEIYEAMLGHLLPQMFPTYSRWMAALPMYGADHWLHSLFLREMGYAFYLDRGFVKEPPRQKMTETESKYLSAIDYLVRFNLSYYSATAGYTGVPEGIFPRGSYKVKRAWTAEKSIHKDLFKAMEAYGLEYENGVWSEKKDSGDK